MTILIGNETELKEFDYDIIKSNPILEKNSKNFFDNTVQVQNSIRCLFVGQREYATLTCQDPFIDIIGTDDATTCHIVLIVDEITNNCSLCHFDGSELDEGINEMIKSLKELSPNDGQKHTYSLSIAGGFDDDRDISIDLTLKLFDIFIKSNDVFNLNLCIVTKLNDVIKDDLHFPIVYGLGYNIKNKNIFMCNRFIDKGPDILARSARHFSSNGNMNIYDTLNYKLVIPAFEYNVYDYLPQCVHLPDNILLEYFSTSPEQEPEYFAKNLKETFKFMLQHPKPLKTYFKDKTAFVYSKEENGKWQINS